MSSSTRALQLEEVTRVGFDWVVGIRALGKLCRVGILLWETVRPHPSKYVRKQRLQAFGARHRQSCAHSWINTTSGGLDASRALKGH